MAQVTTAAGITVTDQMTPEARFSAIAESMGVQLGTVDPRAGMGPPLHVHADSVTGGLMDANPPPPAPVVMTVPASKPSEPLTPAQSAAAALKVEAFDAEMRAAGKQTGGTAPTAEPGAVDEAAIAELRSRYTELMKNLEPLPQSQARDSNVTKIRAQFQAELVEFFNGRQRSESRKQFAARQAGQSAPSQAPAASQHSPQAWTEAHVSVASADGMIPIGRINKDACSHYELPALIPDQHYHVSVFGMLANARAQNLSQKQVDGFIKEDMRANGWLKS